MSPSPYIHMQKAVDLVWTSSHPVNKIAATLFGSDEDSMTQVNHWPEPIFRTFGDQTRIGNSSGTLHAETACILKSSFKTQGASVCVTDPFCPNCAKNMAEAGIKTIYIDHKGFDKDFAKRRQDHFEKMSMHICEKAGISVYVLHRKEKKVVPIWECPENFHAHEENPIEIYYDEISEKNEADLLSFQNFIKRVEDKHHGRRFAAAFGYNQDGALVGLAARAHAVAGFSAKSNIEQISKEEKYSLMLEPLGRILMAAGRYGIRIVPDYIYTHTVPTSRELVNFIGAGYQRLYIGDMTKARDDSALKALAQLSEHALFGARSLFVLT